MSAQDPRDTAAHMLLIYRESSYTARERANDHAMAYDIGEPQRVFWLAVVEAIDAALAGR